MALNDDKIKDLFASKFDNFEPEVPPYVWEGIDQLLSEESSVGGTSGVAPSIRNNKKRSSILRVVLISTAVAASLAIGIFIAFDPSKGKVELFSIVEEVEPNEIDNSQQVKEIVKEELVEPKKIVVQTMSTQPAMIKILPVVDLPQADNNTTGGEADIVIGVDNTNEDIYSPSQSKNSLDNTADEVAVRKTRNEESPLPQLPKKKRSNNMSLSLRSNAGALAQDVENSGGGVLFSKTTRSSQFVKLLEDENKDYELSHKQPISVGLTVSKQVSNNISLETGLMFTYLSSKITSNSALNLKEEQTFGYLGIPVYVNYDFYELGKAKFYISLGFTMQKDVFGEYTSRMINGEEAALKLNTRSVDNTSLYSQVLYAERSYIKENISQKHWQFSSHLTVGASYPIYKKLKVYTSIGGAYYFDANNEYRTIYSDREFQLDLNLGLKVDF